METSVLFVVTVPFPILSKSSKKRVIFPVMVFITPLPQNSIVHDEEHPSQLTVSPSSHCSPISSLLFPQVFAA